MENNINNKQESFLRKEDKFEEENEKNIKYSNNKVFPISNKKSNKSEEDVRIISIYDPETGKYIKKYIKKIKS